MDFDGPASQGRFHGIEASAVNRDELQTLTRERLLDLDALIREKRWSFAYYVAGYVVECALVSCVLSRMIYTGWVFEEKAETKQCRIHDFQVLINIAGLREKLNEQSAESAAGNRAFVNSWATAIQWKPDARYTPKSEADAMALRNAVVDMTDGIYSWITQYW